MKIRFLIHQGKSWKVVIYLAFLSILFLLNLTAFKNLSLANEISDGRRALTYQPQISYSSAYSLPSYSPQLLLPFGPSFITPFGQSFYSPFSYTSDYSSFMGISTYPGLVNTMPGNLSFSGYFGGQPGLPLFSPYSTGGFQYPNYPNYNNYNNYMSGLYGSTLSGGNFGNNYPYSYGYDGGSFSGGYSPYGNYYGSACYGLPSYGSMLYGSTYNGGYSSYAPVYNNLPSYGSMLYGSTYNGGYSSYTPVYNNLPSYGSMLYGSSYSGSGYSSYGSTYGSPYAGYSSYGSSSYGGSSYGGWSYGGFPYGGMYSYGSIIGQVIPYPYPYPYPYPPPNGGGINSITYTVEGQGQVLDATGRGVNGLIVRIKGSDKKTFTVSLVNNSGQMEGGFYFFHDLTLRLEGLELEIVSADNNQVLTTSQLPQLNPYSLKIIPDISLPDSLTDSVYSQRLRSLGLSQNLPANGDYDGDLLSNQDEILLYLTHPALTTIPLALDRGLNLYYCSSFVDSLNMIPDDPISRQIYSYNSITKSWRENDLLQQSKFNAVYTSSSGLLFLNLRSDNQKPILTLEGFTSPQAEPLNLANSEDYLPQDLFDPAYFNAKSSSVAILKNSNLVRIQMISHLNSSNGKRQSTYRFFGRGAGEEIILQANKMYTITKGQEL